MPALSPPAAAAATPACFVPPRTMPARPLPAPLSSFEFPCSFLPVVLIPRGQSRIDLVQCMARNSQRSQHLHARCFSLAANLFLTPPRCAAGNRYQHHAGSDALPPDHVRAASGLAPFSGRFQHAALQPRRCRSPLKGLPQLPLEAVVPTRVLALARRKFVSRFKLHG